MRDLEDYSICSAVLTGTGLIWSLNYLLFLDAVSGSSFLLSNWQLLCLSPGKKMQWGLPHVAHCCGSPRLPPGHGETERIESPQSAVHNAKNCLSIWQTLCWELAWKSISPPLSHTTWTLTGTRAVVRSPLPDPLMLAGDTAIPWGTSEWSSSVAEEIHSPAPKQRLQTIFAVDVELTQLPSPPVDYSISVLCVPASRPWNMQHWWKSHCKHLVGLGCLHQAEMLFSSPLNTCCLLLCLQEQRKLLRLLLEVTEVFTGADSWDHWDS